MTKISTPATPSVNNAAIRAGTEGDAGGGRSTRASVAASIVAPAPNAAARKPRQAAAVAGSAPSGNAGLERSIHGEQQPHRVGALDRRRAVNQAALALPMASLVDRHLVAGHLAKRTSIAFL